MLHPAWPHMNEHKQTKALTKSWLVQIVFNPETGKSKGFGFVKFDDARDAEDAINEANGKVRPSQSRALPPFRVQQHTFHSILCRPPMLAKHI